MKTCKRACCTIFIPEDLNAEAVRLVAKIKKNLEGLGVRTGQHKNLKPSQTSVLGK